MSSPWWIVAAVAPWLAVIIGGVVIALEWSKER